MTQKIKFHVVYATGSDEEHSSSSLESHGPSVKGWRSERFCVYPQELILQLPSAIRVRKLQLLSHQYLIGRKVELFIGTCRPGTSPHYQSASFSRLGYISFDSNEKTTFKARELKSVHLDCEGLFLKLVCQKNHVNKLNIFNQVGIVAVNVLGDYTSQDQPQTYHDVVQRNENTDPALLGQINRPSHLSMIDDITFGVYQDPEVAKVIEKLEMKKHQSIEEEKYDYAKRLKQAISDLYKVGEKLGRLEQEKKAAVSAENYDLAQAKKVQADEIRIVVFEQLNIHTLLDTDKLRTDEAPLVLVRSPPHQLPALGVSVLHSQDSNIQQITSPAQRPPPDQQMPRHFNPEPAYNFNEVADTPPINDDRPIPALSNKLQQEAAAAAAAAAARGAGDEPPEDAPRDPDGPDEHSMKVSRDLTQAIDMFGHETVACLFCKQYAMRDRGLNEISKVLQSSEKSTPTMVRALIQVFKQAFTDPVFNTLSLTLDIFKTFLKSEVMSKNHTIELCNVTTPILLRRVGENMRLRQAIESFIIELSDIPSISNSNCIANITVSACKEKNPKVLTGRLTLLEQMIGKLGVDENTYTVESVMKFVAPTLSHTARDVRDVAIRITLYMYKECGDPVRKHLPKDTPVLRKKQLIWKKIFESFDEIDGKPVNKPNEPTAEERKAQQVAALKSELAQLREMAAGQNLDIPEELKAGNEHMKMTPKKKKRPVKKAVAEEDETDAGPRMSQQEAEEQLDRTCMFCNEHNEHFNAETLDLHFWKSCPMLRRCDFCSQVVEIAGTTTHLVTECKEQEKFELCEDCQLAKNKTSPHQCSSTPGEGETLCPLCSDIVKDGEEGWRDHLMGSNGCTKNSRKPS